MKTREITELYGKMCNALRTIEDCPEFSHLIPEVRSNLVYAASDARTPDEVIGVDGRITIVEGAPRAAGRLKFGASNHMARMILELKREDPSIRAGINFACNQRIIDWLADYCRKKGWSFCVVDRGGEPEEIREKEGASAPWKVREAIRLAGGRVPKIFCNIGALGKEDLSMLVGTDPLQVAQEMCQIAKSYASEL